MKTLSRFTCLHGKYDRHAQFDYLSLLGHLYFNSILNNTINKSTKAALSITITKPGRSVRTLIRFLQMFTRRFAKCVTRIVVQI